MSFATTIGHVHVHVPRRRTAVQPATPAPAMDLHDVRRWGPVDAAVADERQELEQWSVPYMLAVGLNR